MQLESEIPTPESETVSQIVDSHLLPKNDFIYGFADLIGLIHEKFGKYQYGISIGKRLNERIIEKVVDGPTWEYYQHYRQLNEELARIADHISADFQQAGIPALNISPSVSTSELNTRFGKSLRTDLSHKMVATRAGLGWIGKTDLFISKIFGPRVRLVTILTSTPLKSSSVPFNTSQCGRCTICIEACPAKAANGKAWDITIDRDEFFDAHKCRDQCKKFGTEQLKMDIRICGICVAVCPQPL